MFKPFSDANRGLNSKLCIYIMLKQEAEARIRQRPDAQPRPQPPGYRSDPRKNFSFFVFVSVMMRTDGSAIGCSPTAPPQALVPWSPRRQQIRGAARHGTARRPDLAFTGRARSRSRCTYHHVIAAPALALAGTATGMHLHGLFLSSVPGLI
jgi:hypothetical protein